MPYFFITVPSGTVIGRTVDATVSTVPARVTPLSERTLRIEPDLVCRIITTIGKDGETTLCAYGSGRWDQSVA